MTQAVAHRLEQAEQRSAGERAASFNRRTFLRGLGACFALPAFESLRPLVAAEAGAVS